MGDAVSETYWIALDILMDDRFTEKLSPVMNDDEIYVRGTGCVGIGSPMDDHRYAIAWFKPGDSKGAAFNITVMTEFEIEILTREQCLEQFGWIPSLEED